MKAAPSFHCVWNSSGSLKYTKLTCASTHYGNHVVLQVQLNDDFSMHTLPLDYIAEYAGVVDEDD